MHNYYKLFYHLIWTTKNREQMITEEVKNILIDYLPMKIKYLNGECHSIGVSDNHIHLIVTIPVNISISSFIKRIKGSSARSVNYSIPSVYFGWQKGYGIISFHQKLLPYMIKYADNQKQHHKISNLVNKLEEIYE